MASRDGQLWAEEAKVWTAALLELPSQMGGSAYRYFWDPNVEFDFQSMVPAIPIETGEGAFSFMLSVLPPRSDAAVPMGPAFISTDGVVFQIYLDWGPSGMDTTDITATPAQIVNILDPIGMHGGKKMVSAFSSEAFRERRPSFVEPFEADELAAWWVDAWSDPSIELSDVYAEGATYVDSIAGIRTAGLPELDLVRETQSATTWRISQLPDGTSAVYPLGSSYFILDGLVVVVDGDDGTGCPGELAVLLTMSNGTIVSEERFRTIDQARRCVPDDELPGGWWQGRELRVDETLISVEDLVTVTGWIQVNGARINVYNGTDELESALRWALGRFEQAGLAMPAPESITFTRHLELCDEVLGRSMLTDDGWRLYLCFDETGQCTVDDCASLAIRPKHILLHELAHVWMYENLTDSDRATFTNRLGLEVWEDRTFDWADQAREHAAETIAWGLLDRPLNLYRIGLPDEVQLRSQFRFLTGREVIQPGGQL